MSLCYDLQILYVFLATQAVARIFEATFYLVITIYWVISTYVIWDQLVHMFLSETAALTFWMLCYHNPKMVGPSTIKIQFIWSHTDTLLLKYPQNSELHNNWACGAYTSKLWFGYSQWQLIH